VLKEKILDELRTALELATPEELEYLTKLLFSRKFNPLDYLQTPDPLDIQSQDWDDWLDSIEERIRYLAADGFTVLRGATHQVSYRQILIQVCRYLKIPYAQRMTTTEIETEIFLNLVSKAWEKLPKKEQNSLNIKVQKALAKSNLPEPLPAQLQHNPLNILIKGSSALAVNSLVKPFLLKQIAQQLAFHFATYQATKNLLIKGGTAALTSVETQIAIQTAKRGITLNAARYGAVKTVFAVLGPLLWISFFADLGWKTIATNYGRIIPTIFTLAQIRLTRSEWEFCPT
jgi:uncharacterized protein YaaW (UPF0174 family)